MVAKQVNGFFVFTIMKGFSFVTMKSTRYYIALLCLLTIHLIVAQTNGCDGTRYKIEVFGEVNVSTVKYGRNISVGFNQDSIDLMMDVYEPKGDKAISRPAIILAFGGAFISGDRTQLSDLARYYARLGYVAACIDYRTYPVFILGFPDSTAILDVAIKALGDMKASIRYMRSAASQYKVDTNMIFIGGVSAGAITAIQCTYLHADDVVPPYFQKVIDANGGFQGSSNNATLKYSTKVSGVLNLSGAIFNLSWIRAGDPPMASMHGTADPVVPYGAGKAAGLVTMNGSGAIDPVLKSKKINEILMSVPGGMHTDIYFDAQFKPYLDSFTNQARKFFADIVCSQIISSNSLALKTEVKIYPNPASDYLLVSGDQKIRSVKMYDMMGREIPVRFVDRRIEWNYSNIIPGVYAIDLKYENGQWGTVKVLVR